MQSHLSTNFGINPDVSTVSKALKNMKITNKTIVRVPVDRNTPELAWKRMEWRYLNDAKAKLVYIDESGFNLHPTSGRDGQ